MLNSRPPFCGFARPSIVRCASYFKAVIYLSSESHEIYSPLAPGTLRLQLCEYSSVGAPGAGPDAIETEPWHAVGARARILSHSADEGLHRESSIVLVDPLVRVRVRVRVRV